MRRLGFLLFATSVLAQSQIQQLSEVVLTAQRINSPISPLSFTLVSDSLGGLLQQEIGEQLGIVPSLFVSSQQNFTQDTRISIRGFGTRAAFGIRGVKVLLDGVPISTPDGQAQLDHIPLLQLGGVAVYSRAIERFVRQCFWRSSLTEKCTHNKQKKTDRNAWVL